MMNGRFKSTRHRVMDINRERYSVPFFLEPGFYSDVGVNWISIWTGVFVHKVIGYTVTRYENHVTELEFSFRDLDLEVCIV